MINQKFESAVITGLLNKSNCVIKELETAKTNGEDVKKDLSLAYRIRNSSAAILLNRNLGIKSYDDNKLLLTLNDEICEIPRKPIEIIFREKTGSVLEDNIKAYDEKKERFLKGKVVIKKAEWEAMKASASAPISVSTPSLPPSQTIEPKPQASVTEKTITEAPKNEIDNTKQSTPIPLNKVKDKKEKKSQGGNKEIKETAVKQETQPQSVDKQRQVDTVLDSYVEEDILKSFGQKEEPASVPETNTPSSHSKSDKIEPPFRSSEEETDKEEQSIPDHKGNLLYDDDYFNDTPDQTEDKKADNSVDIEKIEKERKESEAKKKDDELLAEMEKQYNERLKQLAREDSKEDESSLSNDISDNKVGSETAAKSEVEENFDKPEYSDDDIVNIFSDTGSGSKTETEEETEVESSTVYSSPTNIPNDEDVQISAVENDNDIKEERQAIEPETVEDGIVFEDTRNDSTKNVKAEEAEEGAEAEVKKPVEEFDLGDETSEEANAKALKEELEKANASEDKASESGKSHKISFSDEDNKSTLEDLIANKKKRQRGMVISLVKNQKKSVDGPYIDLKIGKAVGFDEPEEEKEEISLPNAKDLYKNFVMPSQETTVAGKKVRITKSINAKERSRNKNAFLYDKYEIEGENISISVVIVPITVPEQQFGSCETLIYVADTESAVCDVSNRGLVSIDFDNLRITARGNLDDGIFSSSLSAIPMKGNIERPHIKKIEIRPETDENIGMGHTVINLDYANTMHIMPVEDNNLSNGLCRSVIAIKKKYGTVKASSTIINVNGYIDNIEGEKKDYSIATKWNNDKFELEINEKVQFNM